MRLETVALFFEGQKQVTGLNVLKALKIPNSPVAYADAFGLAYA